MTAYTFVNGLKWTSSNKLVLFLGLVTQPYKIVLAPDLTTENGALLVYGAYIKASVLPLHNYN